jgi:hypothetical protein
MALSKSAATTPNEAVTCHACARMHLVNPKTGEVLGDDDDE